MLFIVDWLGYTYVCVCVAHTDCRESTEYVYWVEIYKSCIEDLGEVWLFIGLVKRKGVGVSGSIKFMLLGSRNAKLASKLATISLSHLIWRLIRHKKRQNR